jgi:RpiR family carbohydrate utilization transcriptional regulator
MAATDSKCCLITHIHDPTYRIRTSFVSLLDQLNSHHMSFSKAEQKVVATVLANPSAVTRISIANLARTSGVSEPTVNRLCKRLGASGFPDFKLQLALALAAGARFVNSAVNAEDDIETFAPKLFDASIATLAKVRDQIDTETLSTVIQQIVRARQVYFFGQGNSGPVALDAEIKFFRFKIPVSAQIDPMMQRMIAAAAQRNDLFVLISHTGRTEAMVDHAKLARDSGAKVVSITAPGSPLAKTSDIAITLDVAENTDEYLPMTSRLAQLTVLDVIATGVTLAQGDGHLPHLARIKESLQSTRLKAKSPTPEMAKVSQIRDRQPSS